MGDAVGSRESVGEYIDLLEGHYGSFSINQTTVTVPAEGYERAAERAAEGAIDAYVRVWNDEGEALHVRCEEAFPLDTDQARFEERIRTCVRETDGVDARLDDVSRVTIAGIRNEDDQDAAAVYRLFVLFDAAHARGSPEDGEWETDVNVRPEFVTWA